MVDEYSGLINRWLARNIQPPYEELVNDYPIADTVGFPEPST